MATFGKKAVELVKEIASADGSNLPAFAEEGVRLVLNDIYEHQAAIDGLVAGTAELERQRLGLSPDDELPDEIQFEHHRRQAVSLMANHEAIRRNKRLLLAYAMERCRRLQALRWSRRALPQDLAANCSPEEVDFFKSYDRCLSRYMGSGPGGCGLDITLDASPPKEPSVHVRCLVDYGEVVFSSGSKNLSKGYLCYLPADEAEPLVREGVLERVAGAQHH